MSNQHRKLTWKSIPGRDEFQLQDIWGREICRIVCVEDVWAIFFSGVLVATRPTAHEAMQAVDTLVTCPDESSNPS